MMAIAALRCRIAMSNVTAANDAPIAKADTATVYADHAATINLVANDTDADGDRFTITGVTGVSSKGSVVINSDGTITYTAKDSNTVIY